MTPAKVEFPKWMRAAYSCLGEREKTRGDNGAIQLMFALSGNPDIKSDEVPWCAAFVGAALDRAGILGTGSLMARSYLKFGEALKDLRVGAIVVFPRGSNPANGHVGFALRWTEKSVYVLGGNQSDAVSVKRFNRADILPGGIRWPLTQPSDDPHFEAALSFVLRDDIEGGWTDDPEDPGGATNRGVTIGRYSQFLGRKASKEELRNITEDEIRFIYETYYWFAAFCDQYPAPLNIVHFDCAVNQGPGRAASFSQKALGVADDGDIGPKTIAAAKKADFTKISAYLGIRKKHYQSLPHFWRFGKGWLNRLNKLADFINSAPVETTQPAPAEMERKPMQPATPKWWLNSKTIWGNLIAALSVIIPPVAAIMGWPITGDDIQLFGELGISLIETIGPIVGALISVYGRFNAVAPLERKPVTISF